MRFPVRVILWMAVLVAGFWPLIFMPAASRWGVQCYWSLATLVSYMAVNRCKARAS